MFVIIHCDDLTATGPFLTAEQALTYVQNQFGIDVETVEELDYFEYSFTIVELETPIYNV
jgi:hypothetical protein